MINCNPETVSTDYDTATGSTSSRSPEDVRNVIEAEPGGRSACAG